MTRPRGVAFVEEVSVNLLHVHSWQQQQLFTSLFQDLRRGTFFVFIMFCSFFVSSLWQSFLKVARKDVLVPTRSVRPARVPGHLVLRHLHHLFCHRRVKTWHWRRLPLYKVREARNKLLFSSSELRFVWNGFSFGFHQGAQTAAARKTVYFWGSNSLFLFTFENSRLHLVMSLEEIIEIKML